MKKTFIRLMLLRPSAVLRGDSSITIAKSGIVTISLFLLVALSPVYALAQANTDNSSEGVPPSVESRRLQARMAEAQQNVTEQKKSLLLQEHQLQSLKTAIDESLKEMEVKLSQIKREQARLETLLAQTQIEEAKRLRQLSKIYENMTPAKAAQSIGELDQQLAASLLGYMRPRAAAKILDNLSQSQATELSLILISQQSP